MASEIAKADKISQQLFFKKMEKYIFIDSKGKKVTSDERLDKISPKEYKLVRQIKNGRMKSNEVTKK